MIVALAALTAGRLLRTPKVDVFYSPTEACQSCATFYPRKTPNWHEDDMAWARECRVGKCSFEPPWAGGPENEACENWNAQCDAWKDAGRCESSLEKEYVRHVCRKSCNLCDPLKEAQYCLSFDPVAWYDDCQKILLTTAHTTELASKACEYEEQITLWDRSQPFVALNDRGVDDCQATIAKGALYYSEYSMVDSIDLPLEFCCARVHSFFSCLGQLEPQVAADTDGLGKLDAQSRTTVENFKRYCVPLFQYPTRATFCATFPTSDPCTSYVGCTACVTHKGKWCRTSKTCEVKGDKCPVLVEDADKCVVAPVSSLHPSPPPAENASSKKKTKIDRNEHWWWQLIHNGHLFARNYIPDPSLGVREGLPKHFDRDLK